MFKDAFIAALATTDSNFPLQLWDQHPRSKTHSIYCMLCALTPKNWRMKFSTDHTTGTGIPWPHLDAKPSSTKKGTHGSWASRGVNARYLGPSKDHYQCDLYYIIETQAYRISGSTELFPQHCQLPDMTLHQHLRALMKELAEATAVASNTPKGKRLLKFLIQKIEDLLHPAPPIEEQRVENKEQLAQQMEEQRVINETPIITIPRITDLPPIVTSNNPTAKRKLKGTKRHR
jgi:hypothetical protein